MVQIRDLIGLCTNFGNFRIKELIHNPHKQCLRAYNFISSVEVSKFYDINGDEIVIDKNKFVNIYLLSLTLENLDSITANIHQINNPTIDKKVYSISLYDFYIISDILRGPSEFFLYLDRRYKSIEKGKIHSYDEIDIFSVFISQGLVLDDFDDMDLIDVTSFSNDIDDYYLFNKHEKDKPKLPINPYIRNLVKQIEDKRIEGFIEIGKELISYAYEPQKKIVKSIIRIIKKCKRTGESDFYLFSNESKTGITFYLIDEEKMPIHILEKKFNYLKDKKLLDKNLEKWFLIILA
jgi:hypothetical protein